MFVADAHCDTLYSIAVQNNEPEKCMITAERLAKGGVGLQTFALFAGSKGPGGTPYRDGIDMRAAAPGALPMQVETAPDARMGMERVRVEQEYEYEPIFPPVCFVFSILPYFAAICKQKNKKEREIG